MKHPFGNHLQIATLEADVAARIGGAISTTDTALTKSLQEIRPPVYTTLAIGEEGGIFPEPESH